MIVYIRDERDPTDPNVGDPDLSSVGISALNLSGGIRTLATSDFFWRGFESG